MTKAISPAALCKQGGQLLAGKLFSFNAQRRQILPLAQAGENGASLLLQGFADLGLPGVFFGDGRFGQLNDAEIAKCAQSLLIFRHTGGKVGGVHLAHTDEINVLHTASPLRILCTG